MVQYGILHWAGQRAWIRQVCLQVKVFMELIPIYKIENEQYLCTSIHDRLVEIEISVERASTRGSW